MDDFKLTITLSVLSILVICLPIVIRYFIYICYSCWKDTQHSRQYAETQWVIDAGGDPLTTGGRMTYMQLLQYKLKLLQKARQLQDQRDRVREQQLWTLKHEPYLEVWLSNSETSFVICVHWDFCFITVTLKMIEGCGLYVSSPVRHGNRCVVNMWSA